MESSLFSSSLIGIYGGTFDPIHLGHLRSALEVKEFLGLEKIHFIPCFKPVHRGSPSVSSQHRCKMIELAIQSEPSFMLDRVEIEKGGASYTVNTLEVLSKSYVDKGMVLIMGTDAFAKFTSWYKWERILELVNLAVMQRPGDKIPINGEVSEVFRKYKVDKLSKKNGQIIDVPITQLDLSATKIRDNLKQGKSTSFLIPHVVDEYIKRHHLYQVS